jgi:glutamate-ammonia-ligase adenylyltransferase
LLPDPIGDNAAQAYRSMRQIQHRARLNEEPTQVEMEQAQVERDAGLALWAVVFG